jgi:hypothetical protein
VTGGAGCLDVSGGSLFVGNGLTVRRCDETSSQRWTLAADGTFRSSGLCARSEGGDLVLLRDCREGGAIQWRAGPDATLVNADARTCLTRAGENEAVRLAACGADGQAWRLP